MIIKDSRHTQYSYKHKFKRLLLPLLMLISLLVLTVWIFSNVGDTRDKVYCDMEKVRGKQFYCQGNLFEGGDKRSDQYARSGQYSAKLGKGNDLQFGPGYLLTDYQAGDYYKASIWRFRPTMGTGALVVSMEPEKAGYRQTDITVRKEESGWELLELYFTIPYHKTIKEVKIYVYTDGQQELYFDDFQVEKMKARTYSLFKPETINIELKQEAIRKLEQKRKEAIAAGVLSTDDNDFVNAKWQIVSSKEEIPVSLRLKGDWLDHLQGNKWSFRVNAKDPNTWNRLVSFSVHTPKARDFLKEWVFHRFLENQDILTTRYDFIKLQLNGQPLGVYAWEEHFEKQLIEYKHKREGPILKFNEEGFWANIKRQIFYLDGINPDNETYVARKENSDIEAFGMKEILGNPVLKSNYETALDLMYQFRNHTKNPDQVFDLPLMAKYFASCDVFGAYHGIAWHNLRFYFNPVTNLLEPIGFDGFSGDEISSPALLGQGAGNPQKIRTGDLFNLLFADQKFMSLYLYQVEKFASQDFLRSFFEKIIPEIREREAFIQEEFQDYTFREDQFIERAQYVYSLLFPYNDLSVKANVSGQSGKSRTIRVQNTHALPLQVVGFGFNNKQMESKLTSPVLLPAATPREVLLRQKMTGGLFDYTPATNNKMLYEEAVPLSFEIPAPENARYVFYQLPGLPQLYYSQVISMAAPDGLIPAQILKEGNLSSKNQAYSIRDSAILFSKGSYTISAPVIIPKGYQVRFEAGARLNFINQAFFLSYSPVGMYGNQENPVQIISSDGTAKGFTLINAGEAVFRNVIFRGFNTLAYQNWNLTGAVTLYETEVEMNKVLIENNHCEDALNIIRSGFQIRQLTIRATFGDGFDADFCKGKLYDSFFQNTGNDCIDFSGSIVQIENCSFDNPGDKGISIGEESSAVISNVTITGANIGIASKDLSVVMAEGINLNDCIQGFAGYQKKPEYGGSNMIVKSYTATKVKKLISVAKGSSIQIDGKLLKF
jgi:hypothetical protein